jgi:integrase
MFLGFCGREGNPTLSAELVASYRVSLVGEGKSSSTVGVHLAAIKALTRAAVKAGLMPAEVASSINDVKGAPRRGNRIGNWLTREQAQELLSLPDRESLKGKRDFAILALLLGCGLRRTELLSEVRIGAIAQRENRWVLVDITGKGNRVRSVAVPAWVKAAIDAWTTAAGITEGKIFRAVRKGGKMWGQDLTPGAVLQIVQHYARAMGLEKLAPHDMRRTCAKLCRKRGGDLEQIKFLLGHASIQTTERYLGAEQDFVSAVNDNLGLEK